MADERIPSLLEDPVLQAPDADDPFAPAHRGDPYPIYASLRARAPLFYHERLGFWLASSAESVRHVLIAHPAEEAKLRADPSLVAGAIEETLRYDAPVQAMFRTTRREMDRFGVRLGADQKVCALIGSANRDPAVFTDPDRFDVQRAPSPHLAFGQGIHHCLGAALARLEARVALTELLACTRELRLDPAGEPRRLEVSMVRGMMRYPLILTPA
jgi:cytochrome P450